MLPKEIISRFRLAVALAIIALLAVSAGTSFAARGDDNRGRGDRGKSQVSRQESPRQNTSRQTPTISRGSENRSNQQSSQTPAANPHRQYTRQGAVADRTSPAQTVQKSGNTPSTNPYRQYTRQAPTVNKTLPVQNSQPTANRSGDYTRQGAVNARTLPGQSSQRTPVYQPKPTTPSNAPARTGDRRDNDSRRAPSIGKSLPGTPASGYSGNRPGGDQRPSNPSYQPRPNQKPAVSPVRNDSRPGDNARDRGDRDGVNRDRGDRNDRDGGDRERGDRQGDHSNVRRSRPDSSAYHRPTIGPSRTSGRTGDHNSYRPKGYRPPTHRDGNYYYHTTHYNTRPLRFGFWYFGNYDPYFCRRSVYFHFGYFPYLHAERVWVGPYVYVSYRSGPIVIDSSYYLNRTRNLALEYAMVDIRKAWTDGRFDLLKNHVRYDEKIAVLLDGKYDYSLDAEDYLEMTSDAIEQIRTVGFTWLDTRERADGQYTLFGKHEFRDWEGIPKTTYVSYTIDTVGSASYITEVGSSDSPLI